MAGSTEMLAAFRELTTAKQLERSDLLDLLRDGIQAALVRKFGPNVKFELNVDELQGTIRVVRLRQVVETVEDSSWQIALEEAQYEDADFQVGDMLEEEVPFVDFGRLAVQAAKQRIIQRVREGERARIREEFTSKVGELLSGEVQQIERGKLVIMLNKFREAEAIIPYREQNHREHFHQGDTIRAVLKRLEETPKGPRLILSRGDPLFVKALFKLEVPEIQQQIVEIRAIAREVGSRTKVAVISRDDSIDPVGACVGLKGSRVQAVVNELGGERIDIVPWSPDPERFARLALAPARVARSTPIPKPRRSRRWWTKTSSRSPSAATGRTCGSRPSSPGGKSISTPAASGWSGAARARCSRRCRPRRRWPPRCRSASCRASRPSSPRSWRTPATGC
jgi:N utilization substance protein A